MAPALTTVDVEQLRHLRAWSQALVSGRRLASATQTLQAVVAVQAQDADAAALGLRVRTTALRRSDVKNASGPGGATARGWFLRGTLHLVAREDAGWLLPLLGATPQRDSRRRLAQLGLTSAAVDDALARIPELLAPARGTVGSADAGAGTGAGTDAGTDAGTGTTQGAPMPRSVVLRELGLAEAATGDARQIPYHLVRLAACSGLVELAGGDDKDPLLVAAHAPRESACAAGSDPQAAAVRLAARYVAGYGPVTLDDLVTWSGLPVPAARRAWAVLTERAHREESDVVRVRFAGTEHLCSASAREQLGSSGRPRGDVRLLPGFDGLLVAYRSRAWTVPATGERQVWPGGGMIRATVLVDGQVRATWTRNRATVVTRPLPGCPDPTDEPGLPAEAADVQRFLSGT